MAQKKSRTVKKTKTARKGKPAKRRTVASSNRCQPLRDQLETLVRELIEIEEDLAAPDIPESIKERLRRLKPQLHALRNRVLQVLEECEAIKDEPRR